MPGPDHPISPLRWVDLTRELKRRALAGPEQIQQLRIVYAIIDDLRHGSAAGRYLAMRAALNFLRAHPLPQQVAA